MIRRFLTTSLICAAIADALPAGATEATANAGTATGLGNMGIGLFLIALAIVLVLSLLLRASATHVARIITHKMGQRRIRRILKARSADVLEDFILPGAYGGLTHIDYAILTSGGILCIRTKHFNGIVFGGPEEPQWTNVDGVHRRKFLNPLIQNEGRTKALQKVVPDVPVASLAVFTGRVQFTSPQEKNVIHVRDLNSYIAKFVFGPCKIKDWDAVWYTVKAAAMTDEETRKDFRAQLSFS